MLLISSSVERVLECIGIGWSLFTLLIFIIIAIWSICGMFTKGDKRDMDFYDEEESEK